MSIPFINSFPTFNQFNGKMFLVSIQFADWLKQARKEKDMTQADLAKAAGLDRSVINKLESGTRPQPETLQSIARGLRKPIESVYRAAGILPTAPASTEHKEEILFLFDQLSEKDKEYFINFMRATLEINSKKS